MATDATGTPTSLGIPKYDTSVDAPSGLGFNATMDVLNTLLGSGFTTVAPADGDIPVWDAGAGRWKRSTDKAPTLTSQIPDNSITTAKYQDSSITSAKIVDGTIATADIANGAITSAKLAGGAVSTSEIAAGTNGQALRTAGGVVAWKELAAVGGAISGATIPSSSYPTGGSGMLGLALSITPTGSGLVVVNIVGEVESLVNSPASLTIRYGTGTAPGNNTGVVGTAVGGAMAIHDNNPVAVVGLITGLVVGTAYWVDVEATFTSGSPQGGNNAGFVTGNYVLHEVG